jgi:hypothetical protein
MIPLDAVPKVAVPDSVSKVVDEGVTLRSKLRDASQELMTLQAELERLEADDISIASQRIREGADPGSLSPAIGKARQALERHRRQVAALELATRACETDLASALTEAAPAWLAELQTAKEATRAKGIAALAALEAAAGEIGEVASAARWVQMGADGSWEHRPLPAVLGSTSRTSARWAANSQEIPFDTLMQFVAELFTEPAQAAPRLTAAPQAAA